jgi:hypothetical protein
MRLRVTLFAILISTAVGQCIPLNAQMESLAPGLRKVSGTEPTSRIAYVRMFLDGIMVPASSPVDAAPLSAASPPVLIGECTQAPNGKLRFELHAHFGDVQDTAYYPPWRASGPDDVFPPETVKRSSRWTSSATPK